MSAKKKTVKAKKKAKTPARRGKIKHSKAVSGRKRRKPTKLPPKPQRRAKPDPYKKLLAKINRIKERVPYIEPTGECTDENTGEVLFRYTEAQHVFEVYRAECAAEGLIYRPYFDVGIMPIIVPIGRGVALVAPFCIEDLETGARLIGFGTGMGANWDWAANTAGTRALKQFLLTTFQCTWKDPEQLNQAEQKESLKAEVMRELEADGTLANIEQVRFWAQQFGKPKETDKKPKKKETKNVKSK